MVPKHRNRRLAIIALCAAGLAVGAWLLSTALKQNLQAFTNPSEIAALDYIATTPEVRVGGIVIEGSVKAGEGLRTEFDLRDFEGKATGVVTVSYIGALPDLFREGQGIVAIGRHSGLARVEAAKVLAKHDENYVPAPYTK